MIRETNNRYPEHALSGIPEDFSGRLLEVPVGTGVLTTPVYKTLPRAEITCQDDSPDMMAQTQRRTENLGLSHVRFQRGDVSKLPFADSSFDVVLLLSGFHAFPDKEIACRETFRVLRPGGICCGCFNIKGENRRTDGFIKHLYTPKGFFTLPCETVDSLKEQIKTMYAKVELETMESMPCFSASGKNK